MAPQAVQGLYRATCRARKPTWSLFELHRGRAISQSWLRKVADGEARWKEQAEKIKNGEARHVWDELEERGFIKDVAGTPQNIRELMRVKRIGAYAGVDPTADSLHLGHLLPLMALFWLWFYGHPVVTLIGGSTARIGDPSGRETTREIMSNADISKNITKVHYQLMRLWQNVKHLRSKYEFEDDWAAKHHVLNNSMWLQGLSVYDFTKRIARQTRMGPMLSRDSAQARLNGGSGMSVSEFIYPLFQGWDFWHLYNKLGVQMQVGGSDQYGNIVAGLDAVRTIRESEEAPDQKIPSGFHHDPIGFTVPLLTDSAGNKFGKSEGNAIWLDEFKTSPFDLYGYFMRRPDDEMEKMLKLFTFLPLDKIHELLREHNLDQSKRVAQHTLAFEVLSLVCGPDRALQEAQQHKMIFGGQPPATINIKERSPDGPFDCNTAPRSDMTLPRSVMELAPAKLLVATSLAASTTQAQQIVKDQGAYVAAQPGQSRGLMPGSLNWTPVKMWFPGETKKFLIDDRLLILRKGKHNVRIVELVSDEEWKESGKIYPGQPYTGAVRRVREELKKELEEKGAELSPKMTKKEVRRRVSELQSVSVANNPHIQLPNKSEVRDRLKKGGFDAPWMQRGRVAGRKRP